MADLLSALTNPVYREGFGAAVTVLAMVFFVIRSFRRRTGGLVLALGGLGFLLCSFILGLVSVFAARVPVAFLEAGNPHITLLQDILRFYLGLPVLLAGTVVQLGPFARHREAEEFVLPGWGAGPGVGETELRLDLEAANRALEKARKEVREHASEKSRMSSKLSETMSLLLASEERFRLVFERAHDGFVLADLENGRITQANPGMTSLTGHEVSVLQGMKLAVIFGSEVAGRGAAFFENFSERSRSAVLDVHRKDGTTVRADVSCSVISLGGRATLLAVVRDATGWEELRAALEAQNRALEERELNLQAANRELLDRAEKMKEMNERLRDLQEVKDNFLSSVSHELRTPLTSIRSFSEILLQYQDAEDDVKQEFIGIINKESERLTRLINDVLDLAKIEAGAMELTLSEVDLGALCADVVRTLSPQARDRGLRIDSRIPADLPLVEGDRDKVHQVLTNLVGNAVKFSGRGTTVRISAEENSEGKVRIAVSDEGPGIPAEELRHIFDKFRQAGSGLTDKPEGTGLGLAICKEIVAMHGGRIWGESEEGKGSTFFFTLKASNLERTEEIEAIIVSDELGLPPPKPEATSLPPIRGKRSRKAGGDDVTEKRRLPPLRAMGVKE